MKKLVLCWFFISVLCIRAFAQDPAFSQSYNNPVYLNPALTGANDGLKINMNDMRQWTAVPGTFNTFTTTADLAEECSSIGLGLIALHDERGEGFLTTDQFGLTGRWGAPIIAKKLDFAFGIGGSFAQKSLDWSKLQFSDQFDPILGQISSTNSQPHQSGIPYADIDAGISLKFLFDYRPGFTVLNNIGFAVHHLNRPDIGLITESNLPSLYTLHAGSVIPISRAWKQKGDFLFPYAVYNWQEVFNTAFKVQREFIGGFYVYNRNFMYGLLYRDGYLPFTGGNTNQLGFSAGYQIPFKNTAYAFQLTYSYTFPFTGLSYSVQGTHEISLIIIFDRVSILCGGGKGAPTANKCYYDKRSGFIPQL